MRSPNKTFKINAEQRTQFLDFSTLSNISVIFLSLDFSIIDYNDVTKKIYKWKRSEVLNKSYLDWCKQHQYIPPIEVNNIKYLLNDLPKLNIENTIDIDNSQHTLLWKIVANLNENDELCGIILIGEEITNQKFYASQMKSLANVSKKITGNDMGLDRTAADYITNVYFYLDTIISCMPCYVYWKDINFVYLGCNNLCAENLNLTSRKDIIGMTDYDFNVPKEIVDSWRNVDEEIIRTGKPQLNIEEYLEVKGTTHTKELLGNKMPIFDEKGKIIGLVGIAVDITERKKWEKELIKAKEAAEAANKLKSEFIHNMEHDIRTPFAGILGMTSILEELEIDLTKKQMIKDVFFCAQELLDYSCGILDFSRIEAGVLPLLTKKFNLKELIQSIVAIEKPAAKMKGLDYIIEHNDDVPNFLIGDEYRLKRILINLLSNAIKFTSNGFVKFTIKILKKSKKNILVNFIVEDSGIGIEKARLNLIYEKFSRGMPSNQGVYKGPGLGLRIVKKFIEETGGEIEIKSTLGKGTKFTCTFLFELPLYDNDTFEHDQIVEQDGHHE